MVLQLVLGGPCCWLWKGRKPSPSSVLWQRFRCRGGWASVAPASTARPPAAAPPSSFLSRSCNKCVLQGAGCMEYFAASPAHGAIWESTISQLQLLFISK